MTYYQVMDMPLRAFWSFNGQVARLRAETDLRSLQIAVAAQSGEALNDLNEQLRIENASPTVVVDNRSDPDAQAKLKAAFLG
jgi:hypothetical protein